MLSIRLLFEETKNLKLSKEEKKHFFKTNKYIKNVDILPEFSCPKIGSQNYQKDIDAVKHYYNNKSLNKDFLKIAHNSCKKVFKKYCKDNNLNVDWKLIKKILSDVEAITFKLKRKFNRPRPKELLANEDDVYSEIKDMGSASFPSGHTTTAYFISELLSHYYPEEANNFKTIAELIGQSRIENGVHYPTDVLYGKLLGEMLADIFLNENDNMCHDILKSKFNKKDQKILTEHLRNQAFKKYGKTDDSIKLLGKELGDFLFRNAKIEGLNLDYEKCCENATDFLRNYSIDDNDDINVILKMLCMSFKFKDLISPYKYIMVHKYFNKRNLEKGEPGMIRSYEDYSKYGNSYSNPKNIYKHMKKLSKITNPYVNHIIFELIHPFCDGNGRLGRIFLLTDLNFNFENFNSFCDKNYFKKIEYASEKYKSIKELLG